MLKLILKINITIILLFLFSDIALSWPENIRHGYSTCTSCHVSPTGGGVLTKYGRSSAGELVSTFKTNDYLDKLPDSLLAGGDFRSIILGSADQRRSFLMQADLEAGAAIDSRTKIVAAVGLKTPIYYDREEKKYEIIQRKNYLLYTLENYSLRAGRFIPAYGIHFADHTLETRRFLGFGPGKESLNVEFSGRWKNGEIFVTGINGTEASIGASEKGYKIKSNGDHGYSTKGSINIENYSFGFSAARLVGETNVRTMFGPFLIAAPFNRLYILTEFSRVFDIFLDRLFVLKTGWEPYRGVHIVHTYQDYLQSNKIGIQLYPIRGLELIAEVEKNKFQTSYLLMMHTYL